MNTTTGTTATAGNTFIMEVKGAKELKKYIESIYELVVGVSYEFNQDLKQKNANVERMRICRGVHDFSAEMCVVAHNDFVKEMTELPQFSEYLKTASVVLSSINQLEHIRKMLVNNKQQKKTAIRRIRKIINMERATSSSGGCGGSALAPGHGHGDGDGHVSDDDMMMIELESPASKVSQELSGLVEMTKQHHRTISAQLIHEQVHPIMRALRTQFILDYKLVVEETIGKIIHHAEKCRAFMLRCRWLALVEYCASSWWHETQKDPMDHSSYSISAVIVGEENDRFNPQKPYTAFIEELTKTPVRIVVTGTHTDDDRQKHVVSCVSYDLSQELAETILTEDAINAFENEQNDLWIQQHHQFQESEQEMMMMM